MRKLFLLFFLLPALIAGAEDLNGIWRGTLTQASGGCFPKYNLELQINFIVTANTLSGKAYDYVDTGQYIKLDFIGRYNSTTKRMVLIENDLLESHISNACVPCVKTYDLTWSKVGDEEILTGE